MLFAYCINFFCFSSNPKWAFLIFIRFWRSSSSSLPKSWRFTNAAIVFRFSLPWCPVFSDLFFSFLIHSFYLLESSNCLTFLKIESRRFICSWVFRRFPQSLVPDFLGFILLNAFMWSLILNTLYLIRGGCNNFLTIFFRLLLAVYGLFRDFFLFFFFSLDDFNWWTTIFFAV